MSNRNRKASKEMQEKWLEAILSHILHITFTNAATVEMGERIAGKCLGRGYTINPKALPVLTFNAFDMDLLHKFYEDIGYKVQPTVVDVNPIRQVDKVLPLITGENQIPGINYSIPVSMNMGAKGAQGALPIALSMFDLIKSHRLQNADELRDKAIELGYDSKFSDDSAYDALFEVYQEYDELLKTEGLITFADQEPIGIQLMDLHPDYLNQMGFWHVVIDEFQDSNDFNMEFVRRLQGCRDIHGGTIKSILVIGDSDQSIYAFRNAVVENFTEFESKIKENKEFENDKIDHFNLVNNYRSTSNILDLANKFVASNEVRIPKKLIAANGAGKPVLVKGFKNFDEELNWCVEDANRVKSEHPEYSVCFMTRNRKGLGKVSQALSKANQTWIIKSSMSILDNTRILAAIHLFDCFGDDESTQGIFDYLTVVSDNTFKDLSEEEQSDAIDALRKELTEMRDKKPYFQRQKMHELLDALDKEDEIYMNWKDMIYQEALIGCQKEGTINNEPFWIYDSIRKFALYGTKVDGSLKRDYEADFILTTAHSSKGLEYDVVYLLLDDFDAPKYHKRTKKHENNPEIEEERRLIFVAMTRAKKELYCTGSYVVYENEIDGATFNMFLRELFVARDGDTKQWEAACAAYRQAKEAELAERKAKNNAKARQRYAEKRLNGDRKAAVLDKVIKGQMTLDA